MVETMAKAHKRTSGPRGTAIAPVRRMHATDHALWMFDFDNTLAPLETAVDWARSRRELQAWLGEQGVSEALFEEFPRGALVLYESLRARLCAGGDAARAVLARGKIAPVLANGHNRGPPPARAPPQHPPPPPP